MVLPPASRISTRTRRRTAVVAGAAQPAVDYGFGVGRVPRSSSFRVDPPQRVSRPQLLLVAAPSASRAPTPVSSVPIPPDRDRAELRGPPPRLRPICTPLALRPNYTLVIRYALFARRLGARATRRACVLCRHTIHCSRLAIGLAHPSLSAFPLTKAPQLLGHPRARWQRSPPYYRRGHCPPRR